MLRDRALGGRAAGGDGKSWSCAGCQVFERMSMQGSWARPNPEGRQEGGSSGFGHGAGGADRAGGGTARSQSESQSESQGGDQSEAYTSTEER